MEKLKFRCDLERKNINCPIDDINKVREILVGLNLIGITPEGIGFGNISKKIINHEFLISGTQTGHINRLDINNYTLITNYDFKKNQVNALGNIKASSETLTHAAIYELSTDINAVIHIHNKELWSRLIGKIPTTDKAAEYGSIELVKEIRRLYVETDLSQKNIFVTAGHIDGIFVFGKTLDEAKETLLAYL